MDEETPRFVLKRSGESVLFEVDKIRRAIYLCLVNSCQMQDEAEVFTIVDNVLDVALPAIETLPAPISVETIQDQVEEAMMVLGHRKEARQYILYRERHRQAREDIPDGSEGTHIPFVRHVAQEWVTRALDLSATYAPREMEGLDLEDFVTRVVRQSYEGISAEQVWELTILTARSQVEWDLRFDALARNLLLLHVEDETGVYSDQDSNVFAQRLHEGVEGGRYDKRLIDGRFDLDRLASALDRNRDMKFGYAGLKDLTDRYLRRQFDHKLLEVPQSFWMRVAMGLSILEDEPTERALQFYELMSTFRYVPSTPTLFNGGTVHMQLASCFLTSVDDSLSGIFKSVGDNAMMSKWAGGLGTDLTNLRASGSLVKGTGGRSKGPVPFMKVFNSQSVAVTQGEIRKGAATMWLAVWHRDIQDFLDSHLRQGDDRMRCHDINIGVWIDDLFMKRYEADEEYTLFCPGSVPGLHDAYGEEFERLYEEYEAKAFRGEIEDFTVVRAKDLYRLILTRCNQGGEPFIGFKDAANLRNPQAHDGVIHSSNLCCVRGDQRAVTQHGILTAQELTAIGGDLDVVGRSGLEKASPMVKTLENVPLYLVETKQGYEHVITGDHPLWDVDKNGWVEVLDLREGDRVEVQSQEGLFGPVEDEQAAFICGLVAGDGTFMESGNVGVDLWKEKGMFALIDEVEAAVKSLVAQQLEFGDTLNTGGKENPTFPGKDDATREKLRLTSALLYRALARRGFTADTKHQVPDFVWRGTRKTVAAYLRGLFAADGTVACDVARSLVTASVSSVHKPLLKEVQILLANFGVRTSLCPLFEASPAKLLPDGKGGYREYATQESWRLLVTNVRACQMLESITGLGALRGNTDYTHRLASTKGYAQKFWVEVSNVTRVEDGDAYCLQVDSDERAWVCNGLITKNTEITLNTSPSKLVGETISDDGTSYSREYKAGDVGVCVLGSVNLAAHVVHNPLDGAIINFPLLRDTVHTAIRMLDNVIDLGFYPTSEARISCQRHRAVALGQMGFQDILWDMRLTYDSWAAVELASEISEAICHAAVDASAELARERGTYDTYEGSTWSQGLMPQDTLAKLLANRGQTDDWDYTSRYDWDAVRAKVKEFGVRNSNLLAIAPTASISKLINVRQGIDPQYWHAYTRTAMGGDFTTVTKPLVDELRARGLWTREVLNEIKVSRAGTTAELSIPEDLKARFVTAFDIDQIWLVRCAAARQRWIDQGQSLNIYMDKPKGAQIVAVYTEAWKLGLKTLYYLRSLGKNTAEKSTVTAATPVAEVPGQEVVVLASCDPNNPDCEACQ